MSTKITLWQPESGELIPKEAKTPSAIAEYAQQLSKKDKRQIARAFEHEDYEMGLNFLWLKTIFALKRELSSVGITLIGEMLGIADIDEDDEIDDILTTRDAIRLSEELGIVSKTDAMRLRHTNDIISVFGQLTIEESDFEDIDESEAIGSLKACIKAVLGRPQVEVATKFVDFRNSIENKALSVDGPLVGMLSSSPYFFQKLTINILMNAAKNNVGAQLENSLANINVILPVLWKKIRDSEKWHVGRTYAEVYREGKSSSVAGLKSVLSKVKGFDFVPENLRSDAFVKAAKVLIRAHEGLNNFYNERSPLLALSKLGTTIPTPALGECITAILCVRLGNNYGVANNAQSLAKEMLESVTNDRWKIYLNQMFAVDARILNKLSGPNPRERWYKLAEDLGFKEIELKERGVISLIKASIEHDNIRFEKARIRLVKSYYG